MGIAIIDNSLGIFDQTAYPQQLIIGDIYTFTFFLVNTGDVDALNVVFTNIIPYGASYIANSLTVNGLTLPGVSPFTGVPLGTIVAGFPILTVSFKLQVTTYITELSNVATVSFQYIDTPGNQPINGNGISNKIDII